MNLADFQRIGRLLFQEGLVYSHGGSLSVREGEKIIITKSDVMLGDLKERDLIEVDLESEEKGEASREVNTHRAVYKATKALAIVQAQPANALAVSLTDNKIVPQDAEGLFHYRSAAIVRVRDGVGSAETARLLPSFLNGESSVAVVRGYGSFAIGKDLETAYRLTSCLENSGKILVAMRASEPPKVQPQEPRRDSRRPMPRQSAIAPSIGVMGRDRFRNKR